MFQLIGYVTDDEISQRRHIHMMLYREKDDCIRLGSPLQQRCEEEIQTMVQGTLISAKKFKILTVMKTLLI